jgi:hypothetical protein
VAFEDETIITQKSCIRKSMSFESEQQKIERDGSRKNFSAYISMVWLEEKLMYNFYDEMNSTNTIDHLESLKSYTMKNGRWNQYTKTLANHNSSSKEGSILKSK